MDLGGGGFGVAYLESDDPLDFADTMTQVMCKAPAWATDLPLNIEIKTMAVYGK
jgi:hypothetical protein